MGPRLFLSMLDNFGGCLIFEPGHLELRRVGTDN